MARVGLAALALLLALAASGQPLDSRTLGPDPRQKPELAANQRILDDGTRRVTVRYTVPSGLHQTLQPAYFGLEFALPPGWTADETAYPPSSEQVLGVDSYSGTFEVSRDLHPPASGAGPTPAVTAKWQICFDDGVCLPPGRAVLALSSEFDWAWVLLLAFLGGLVLNVMPCVLPVLALKLASRPTPSAALANAAGVESSLLALAGVTLALQAGGQAAGWGFQFQSPWYTGLLAALLVALALQWWGLWSLPGLRWTTRPGAPKTWWESFAGGVLTVALATPCTAPFLGTALGLTLGAPPLAVVAVFAAIGLGLALPSLVLALLPGARRWLPKPGGWTRWVPRLGGAALLATALWLGSVLVAQLSPTPSAVPTGWHRFAPDQARAAATQGPVVVEFTAAWCLTCQVNEAGVLASAEFRRLVAATHAQLFWGDDTVADARLDAWLAEYGRNGVPFTLVLRPDRAPQVLPELLTLDALAASLR